MNSHPGVFTQIKKMQKKLIKLLTTFNLKKLKLNKLIKFKTGVCRKLSPYFQIQWFKAGMHNSDFMAGPKMLLTHSWARYWLSLSILHSIYSNNQAKGT